MSIITPTVEVDVIRTKELETASELITRAFVWFATHNVAPDPTWLSDLEKFVNLPRLVGAMGKAANR